MTTWSSTWWQRAWSWVRRGFRAPPAPQFVQSYECKFTPDQTQLAGWVAEYVAAGYPVQGYVDLHRRAEAAGFTPQEVSREVFWQRRAAVRRQQLRELQDEIHARTLRPPSGRWRKQVIPN